MTHPIVIVGSGFAAYQLVKAIRRQDNDTAIYVVTRDDGHDYNKPDLSHVFSKQQSVDDLIVTPSETLAKQLNIQVISHTSVSAIDVADHSIQAGNQTLYYSKLVLATGASPFIPPMHGDASSSLLTLNSLAEFTQCKDRVASAQRLLVIGGGLVGVEVALDLAHAGKEVTIVDPAAALMANQLPDYVSFKLAQQLAAAGVTIRTGCTVQQLTHNPNGSKQVTLSNTETFNLDEIMVCAGLKANTALALQAGITVNRGICVDATMATSHVDVYALGDCAEFDGQIRAYLQPTLISANALAKTLLGQPTPVTLPNMMVKVKTPSYPIQLGGITSGERIARWEMNVQLDSNSNGIVAKALDQDDKLLGFVVTEQHVNQSFMLLRSLSA
ncbi:NADH:flavorubredoxin reductase NorW [Vibrio sp. 10N.261.51.F12]|uniref:NADH:flavorubredoxin reductase NorW n=1 Tax=Vibrio sp. 10N.261.51.F12 TaxID=3229679 RepID=UPI00354E62EC